MTLLGRVTMSEDKSMLLDKARLGAAEAQSTPTMQAARSLQTDGLYRFGFDVGIGLCKGKDAPSPEQERVRYLLGPLSQFTLPDGTLTKGSNLAMQGFSVAQALQLGATKAKHDAELQSMAAVSPSSGAGMLIAAGLSGAGIDPNRNADTMTAVTNNPAAAAGALKVAEKKVGIFTRVYHFLFG